MEIFYNTAGLNMLEDSYMFDPLKTNGFRGNSVTFM